MYIIIIIIIIIIMYNENDYFCLFACLFVFCTLNCKDSTEISVRIVT